MSTTVIIDCISWLINVTYYLIIFQVAEGETEEEQAFFPTYTTS